MKLKSEVYLPTITFLERKRQRGMKFIGSSSYSLEDGKTAQKKKNVARIDPRYRDGRSTPLNCRVLTVQCRQRPEFGSTKRFPASCIHFLSQWQGIIIIIIIIITTTTTTNKFECCSLIYFFTARVCYENSKLCKVVAKKIAK